MSQMTGAPEPSDKPVRRGPVSFFRARIPFTHLLRSVGPLLAIALIVAGFGVTLAHQTQRHNTTPRTADSGATASPALSPTTSGSPTATTLATSKSTAPASNGQTQTSSNSASNTTSNSAMPPYPTPYAFRIQSATVTAAASDNFSHTCANAVYETFTMTITVDPNRPGETVTYGWDDQFVMSGTPHTATVSFAAGETSKTVTFQEGFNAGRGDGSPVQDDAWVDYPDQWQWGPAGVTHATVAFTCVRQLTGLTLTPSISTWNAPCGPSVPVTMTWTVTATPGPQMIAEFSAPTQSPMSFSAWLAPHGFEAIFPSTTGPNDTSSTQQSGAIQTGLTNPDATDGAYWMQVATTAPQVFTARATVVKSCQVATPTP